MITTGKVNLRLLKKWRTTRMWVFLFTLVHVVSVFAANPNQATVKGVVTEEGTGEALIGVTVLIKGTATGTITDIDGAYQLSAGAEDVLVFSYIGYKSQEILVGEQTTINVVMAKETEVLDEIVVIGYGTAKKSDITGSISSVSEEDLKAQPVTSVDQALQGRAAGVVVSTASGEPGGGAAHPARTSQTARGRVAGGAGTRDHPVS